MGCYGNCYGNLNLIGGFDFNRYIAYIRMGVRKRTSLQRDCALFRVRSADEMDDELAGVGINSAWTAL